VISILADATGRGVQGHRQVHPGTFTIARGRFDLPTGVYAPQTYVHHCHILEHDDNDVKRPFTVTP
jgi:FtsP/CotA-like multicopper oxidase with cupredoxin domain